MPAVLDRPTTAEPVDPHRFQVRGWLWLGDAQRQLEAVEAWGGDILLGATGTLVIRPDVNAALALAPDARAGFEFFAHHPDRRPGGELTLHLRARLRGGEVISPLPAIRLEPLDLGLHPDFARWRPAEPTHEARTARWLRQRDGARDFGIEIGAFKSPIPGIRPLYCDRFPFYDYEAVRADYHADAGALPVYDHALDYVANANVFEHLANPVKALWEWTRAVRPGGILYLVVPDRRHTFDHPRPLTAPEHIMADFARDTTDSDGTHIAEYLDGVDWSLWAPAATPAERVATREQLRAAYTAAVAAGEDINIHFHTFELSSFVRLVALMNAHPDRPGTLELLDASEFFPASHPSGFLIVLRVRKSLRARMAGWARRWRARGDVRATLLPTARPFSPAPAG